MKPGLILDLVLAGVILLCAYKGARAGIIKTLFTAAALLVALGGAFFAAKTYAEPLATQYITPFLSEKLGKTIEEKLTGDSEDMAETILNASEKVSGALDSFLSRTDGDEENENETSDENGDASSTDKLVRSFSVRIGGAVSAFLLFILTFALLFAILRVIIGTLDLGKLLPFLKPFDTLCGLILGLLVGLAIVSAPLIVLYGIVPKLFGDVELISAQQAATSKIYSFILTVFPADTIKALFK